jgi:GntR family transcriptional regulator
VTLPLQLSQASGVPFYRQVADQLGLAIRAGVVLPGSALPSVRQLAAELLVSVITIKRAYLELERAGLIAAEPGRGTFVARQIPPLDPCEGLRDALGEAVAQARRLGVPREQIARVFAEIFEEVP